ncbi:uncharacterized protein KY384_002359 [Bacidia gigantensis]|uniref:uncharacterized protein n=1 Tax=Bacidia gigantensis TaxID=2732470 RepID=UPI001D040C05|nr:uncharacterized protein KY384_002359 [Bacidia gigantensis]KAG8532482.1 hypothetical protein KY384_002359 [Bacidia gigantensis]
MAILGVDLSGTLPMLLTISFASLLLLFVYQLVYNLYFHEFANVPGPKFWAATRLRFIMSLASGQISHDVKRIHEKYGTIVRLAPDEISFAKEEAWNEVLGVRPGYNQCLKDMVYFTPPPYMPHNVVGTPVIEDHARMRRALNHSFTPAALKGQEPIVESYVHLLVSQLVEKAELSGSERMEVTTDVVDRFNYTTVDIIGDLVLGESFDCLKNNALHPWITLIFSFVKAAIFAAAPRFYPWFSFLVETFLVPKSLLKFAENHYQEAVAKIHRRMSIEKQRADLMTPLLKQGILPENQAGKGMTLGEIEASFFMLVVAGSETIATTMTGLTTYFLREHRVVELLASEVRSTFSSPSEITIAALNDLPYLNAVIHEALRLCNPIPSGLPRVAPKGGTTVCGLHLPAGTHVSVSPAAIYRSSSLFHKPEEFIPERWFPEATRPAEHINDHLSAVRTFGHGPRSCIGKQLAMGEMRLILAKLVWHFDFLAPEEHGSILDWQTLKVFLTIEKEPVWVKLRLRNEITVRKGSF